MTPLDRYLAVEYYKEIVASLLFWLLLTILFIAAGAVGSSG